MAETIQVKKLNSKEDLIKLVAGNIVEFSIWSEKSLVYNYHDLKKGELFLISRLEMTGVPGGIGAIFENIDVRERYFSIENLRTGNLPKTQDGLFHYGVNIIVPRAEEGENKKFENPEMYNLFDKALKEAGL